MIISREIKLEEYYIAYFDVLGYKQFFESNKYPQMYLLFIEEILEMTKYYCNQNAQLFKCKDVKIKAFSDNVVISIPTKCIDDKNAIAFFAGILTRIQSLTFLGYHMMIRGAFTKGELYINENIVGGKALVRVVELESKAKYPRIILDPNALDYNLLGKYHYNNVKMDDDGLYYFDYIKSYDGEIPEHIKNTLSRKVQQYGSYSNTSIPIDIQESIINKLCWLIRKHNDNCDCLGYETDKLNYKLIMNTKLLKKEIVVDITESKLCEK